MSKENVHDLTKQMKHRVFVFKDSKSESYGYPITAQTRGMFLRDIQEECKRGQAIFARHPQDFAIFEIGEYDPHAGHITLYASKNCLGLVSDFVDTSISLGQSN